MIEDYFYRFRNVLFLIIISVIFGLIRNVILARTLYQHDLGIYSLAMTAISIIYPMLLFGQQKGFIRFFIKHNVEDFNWIKPLKYITIIGLCTSIIIISIITWFYQMNHVFGFFCLLSILSSILLELLSNIIRSKGKFELAILFQRSIRVIISLLAVIFYLLNILSLDLIFIVFGTVHILYVLLAIYFVIKTFKAGNKTIPKTSVKEGLIIFGLDISTLLIAFGLNFLIAKMISLEALGGYFAINIIVRIYEIFSQSTEYIVMPKSGELKNKSIRLISYKLLFIGIILSILFLLLGKAFLSTIYNTKYDEYLFLVPYACIIGFIKLIDVLPTSIINGKLHKKILKDYFVINIILAISLIIISLKLIGIYGIIGAFYGSIIVYIIKAICGYLILGKYYGFSSSYFKTIAS